MPFRAPAPPRDRAPTRPRARSGAVANLGRPRACAFGTLLVVVAVALGCIAPGATAADARHTARRALLDDDGAGHPGVARPVRAAVAQPTGEVRGDRATSRASSPFVPRTDAKNISQPKKRPGSVLLTASLFPPPASPRRSAPI